MPAPVIMWFRQDLRLSDNPAFLEACLTGSPILAVYILDDTNAGPWKMGSASRIWLHHSLSSLASSLGHTLVLRCGSAEEELLKLCKETGANEIFWNRCYEPWRTRRDSAIKSNLAEEGIICRSFAASLLWEPWQIKKSDGTPYKVFTPFFRKGCLGGEPPRAPVRTPHDPPLQTASSLLLDDLNLLPRTPFADWHTGLLTHWEIGEAAAQKRLHQFLEKSLNGYKTNRDFPARGATSRLSPHLHFGEISPHQIWHTAHEYGLSRRCEHDLDHFLSELAWREFSYSLLYHNPTLPESPLQKRFEAFDWETTDNEMLERWQKGMTGYPIVDAGMRELWATGYMHNRVRMIVGSFLVKDLRYHWRHGENWFWDTLVDADLASNAASWQWLAGCGADAAPYFRIFNPTTQGEKFDPTGDYIAKWAPDSHKLTPIVNHAHARNKALEAFKNLP